MRELLVINPNTSESVTTLLQEHLQAACAPHMQVYSVTARFGMPYISDEASYAVGAHAALDAWSAALNAGITEPSAVLVGCFGDPGLLALRESSEVPVSGLAEASFAQASKHGRFVIVTGGERWAPMLRRLSQVLGYSQLLAGIRTVAPTGAELFANPQQAIAVLTDACRDAVKLTGVNSIILGGAALAGMAAQIQPHLDVPVIDSVLAGAQWALALPQ